MRVAVIGAGYWGANLVRVFHPMGGVRAICAFSATRIQQLGLKYPGIRLETSVEPPLTDSTIDGVVIATPAGTNTYVSRGPSPDKFPEEDNALWSFASHDLSVISLTAKAASYTGNDYCRYVSPAEYRGRNILNYAFDRDVWANLFVSWLLPYEEQPLVVMGERRVAVFDYVRPTDKLQIHEKNLDLVDGQFAVAKPAAQTVTFCAEEPLVLERQRSLDCVELRNAPKTRWGRRLAYSKSARLSAAADTVGPSKRRFIETHI